jgi:hypothetical protein
MAKTESTCLLNGVHQLGSPYAAECPLNPERVQRRRERALSIWAARAGGARSSWRLRAVPRRRRGLPEGLAEARAWLRAWAVRASGALRIV